jgi:hypothetical protein
MASLTKTAPKEVTPEALWPQVERLYASRRSRLAEFLFSGGFGKAMSVIEKAFGGGPLKSDGTEIVTADGFTKSLLRDLFERRICALHIPNFCPPEVAANLNAWIMEKSKLENWQVHVFRDGEQKAVDSDVSYGIGIPFATAMKSREDFIKYFNDAPALTREMREVSQGFSPLDRLRLDLDEVWQNGAKIGRYRGLRRGLGLARVMTPGGLYDGVAKTEGVVHVDTLPIAQRGSGRFSANIYLNVPEGGGELAVYSVSPRSIELLRNFALIKHLSNFDATAQEFIRSKLPPPLIIKPKVGDLILIDTSRPHAVRGFTEGHRATLQCWMDYREGMHLALYS